MARTTPDGWQLPYDRYPFATCELGCGQQSTYHRRVRISPMDAYALSLVKLGSGNNLIGYYMYHGGTNPVGRLSPCRKAVPPATPTITRSSIMILTPRFPNTGKPGRSTGC